MCALKWYIKSLYRHLFLEDISKHSRVTKKWYFLICGKLYTQAPWPTRPKLGVWVAKALSCDRMDWLFFFPLNRPPPSPWVIVLSRGGITEICLRQFHFLIEEVKKRKKFFLNLKTGKVYQWDITPLTNYTTTNDSALSSASWFVQFSLLVNCYHVQRRP